MNLSNVFCQLKMFNNKNNPDTQKYNFTFNTFTFQKSIIDLKIVCITLDDLSN